MRTFSLNRNISQLFQCDVLIAGAGPAGVSAAISAARNGAKVVLIDQNNCLGGTWTAGGLGWIIDSSKKTGIIAEIICKLKNAGKICPTPARNNMVVAFDIEGMKTLLEEMCLSEKIKIRYNTLLIDAIKKSPKEIACAVTCSKAGYEAWQAKVYIDATGDGDLGALSGCSFESGNKEGTKQPMSLLSLLTGIDPAEAKDYIFNYNRRRAAVEALLYTLGKDGFSPSYGEPSLFHLGGELYFLMANHQFYPIDNPADNLTMATVNARREINRFVNVLKNQGGVWRNLQLVATAPLMGIREGRRIKGIRQVTYEDIKSQSRFVDSICFSTAGIDIHTAKHGEKNFTEYHAAGFEVPLGAAISFDVDNLMMAGRCIDSDFYAHSSCRISGNAAMIGERVGLCAAKAVRLGQTPAYFAGKDFLNL